MLFIFRQLTPCSAAIYSVVFLRKIERSEYAKKPRCKLSAGAICYVFLNDAGS